MNFIIIITTTNTNTIIITTTTTSNDIISASRGTLTKGICQYHNAKKSKRGQATIVSRRQLRGVTRDMRKGSCSRFCVISRFLMMLECRRTIRVGEVPLVIHPDEEGKRRRNFFDHDTGAKKEGAACFHVKETTRNSQNVMDMHIMLQKYSGGNV